MTASTVWSHFRRVKKKRIRGKTKTYMPVHAITYMHTYILSEQMFLELQQISLGLDIMSDFLIFSFYLLYFLYVI